MRGLIMENTLEIIVRKAGAIAGWQPGDDVKHTEAYMAFLDICAKETGASPPPNREIDLLWHVHMLHPREYVGFCDARFGRVIDHSLPAITEIASFDSSTIRNTASAGCNKP